MLFVIQSCKKSSSTGSGNNFIQISLNGQTYKETMGDIGGTGFSGQVSCTNKPGFLQFGGMIETSQLEFEAYLYHNEDETDFAAASSSSVRLVDSRDHFYSFNGACNRHLDLNISFLDKLLNDESCSVETTGRTHTVESVTLVETTSTEKVYVLKGSFACTIRNSANVLTPLTGTYQIGIRTLR